MSAAVEQHSVVVRDTPIDVRVTWPLGVISPTPVIVLLADEPRSLVATALAEGVGALVVEVDTDLCWEEVVGWVRSQHRRLRCDPDRLALVTTGLAARDLLRAEDLVERLALVDAIAIPAGGDHDVLYSSIRARFSSRTRRNPASPRTPPGRSAIASRSGSRPASTRSVGSR